MGTLSGGERNRLHLAKLLKRLRSAYFVKCVEVMKDGQGKVVELRCTYDPATRGGDAPDGRKVKATLHWVSAAHAVPAEVRLYDRLFTTENPDEADEGRDFMANLSPNSLEVLSGCWVEPSLAGAKAGSIYQFERQGYFCVESRFHQRKIGLQSRGFVEG